MWKSFENVGFQTSEKVSWGKKRKKETCAKHKIDRSQNGRSNKWLFYRQDVPSRHPANNVEALHWKSAGQTADTTTKHHNSATDQGLLSRRRRNKIARSVAHGSSVSLRRFMTALLERLSCVTKSSVQSYMTCAAAAMLKRLSIQLFRWCRITSARPLSSARSCNDASYHTSSSTLMTSRGGHVTPRCPYAAPRRQPLHYSAQDIMVDAERRRLASLNVCGDLPTRPAEKLSVFLDECRRRCHAME